MIEQLTQAVNALPYGMAIAITLALFVVLSILKRIVLKRAEALAKKTETDLDDFIVELVESFGWPFYLAISLYVGVQFVELTPFWVDVSNKLLVLFTVYYSTRVAIRLVDYGIKKYYESHNDKDLSILELIGNIVKMTLWFVALMLIIQNWGFDISALVAGVGIGGIAIAFAVQNILGDIFASFSIYFDKPFKKGDFIVIGDDSGTVERIGLKSTRIRTLQGEELVVSNKELTETRIHNYKRMRKKTIFFKFGIAYETPTKKLKKVHKIMADIFKGVEDAELSRVHFREYGDFALIYEVMYYVKNSDYITYLNVQEEINMKMKERFEKEGIEFAYPTQTIYLKKG